MAEILYKCQQGGTWLRLLASCPHLVVKYMDVTGLMGRRTHMAEEVSMDIFIYWLTDNLLHQIEFFADEALTNEQEQGRQDTRQGVKQRVGI